MTQSNKYKHIENVERINDIVGAEVEKDQLKVSIVEQAIDELDIALNDDTDREVGQVSLKDGSLDITDRDGRNLGTVDIANAIDITDDDGRVLGDVDVVNKIETALDAALESNAGDNLQVTRPATDSTQLANSADISGGVTHPVTRQDVTVYVDAEAATDITISYSPDDGTTWVDDPDGVISFGSADSTLVEIGYDAQRIQVSASDTTACSVWVVEQ